MKDALRFAFPGIGAFLLGVFPGMNWLERYAATSPRMLGVGEQIFIILFLASSGSILGIAAFRFATSTTPVSTDAAIVVAYTLVFGFIGFLYLLILVV